MREFQGFTTNCMNEMRRKKAQNSSLNRGVQFVSKIAQETKMPDSN
jgi:hypothetical protein